MSSSNRKRKTPGPVLGHENGFPVVPVTVARGERGNYLVVHACPYCGEKHVHGGGRPNEDPHEYAFHRVQHCINPPPKCPGYVLRIVEKEAK